MLASFLAAGQTMRKQVRVLWDAAGAAFSGRSSRSSLPTVAAFGLLLTAAAPTPVWAAVSTPMTVVSTGQCMGVGASSQANAAAVVQWPCVGVADQQWQVQLRSDGYYSMAATHSGQCLDVYGADTNAGAAAIQWPCSGGPNQQFSLRAQGQGFALVARHSSLCLGVEGASAVQGAKITQQACNASSAQTWKLPALSGVASVGSWTPPAALSLVPVAAANLPNGKVLMWSAYERLSFGGDNGRTYTLTFDPISGGSSEVLVSNTGHDMFCPGITNLADGRVIVTGGSSSSKTSIYDPATGVWSASSAMNLPRGYHASVSLSTGEVFTIGGSWSGGQGNKDGEVWSPATGAWRRTLSVMDDAMLTADKAGVYRADNHAWLFAASNGRVFHAGPSKRMNWFGTTGNGSVTNAGNRGNDGDAMNGNAVMVGTNTILTMGGAIHYDGVDATNNAHVINIGSNPVSVRQVASMAYARSFHNSVALPNGNVVVVGGQSYPAPFSDDRAVLAAEMWNARTETFSTMAPMSEARTYHSVALLLPDGRVLSGGGGLCGGCATNHPNVQIFSPPYLFKADGTLANRPVLNSAPTLANAGTNITVTTNSAVNSFALVRLASATHSVNNEQRRVAVGFSTVGTNTYSLALTGNRGVLVPGHYMLFAMNSAGVPSVSRTVRIQ
jgi:galactose oxidase